MPTKAEVERNLRLISRAWGRKQSGFVFFPYINRAEQIESGSRKKGFHEGPAFQWPQEKDKILEHCMAHTEHDLYWSTSMFEYPIRREDYAMDEHALWADLDPIDPHTLDEYPPTMAWESSPGRYQALWLAAQGDFQGASWPGNENQRLTYLIGADPSGWDTVQLLRMPGWENHKPEYKRPDGSYPQGELLWANGARYLPGDFDDLPEIAGVSGQLTDALESEIDAIDRHKVIARVRLKMTHRSRDMLTAREVSGDRSGQLWYLIRSLADVGCSVAEIVAIVRDTVWNKFAGRSDEQRRLILEASKAIAQRSEDTTAKLEDEEVERPDPQRLGFLLANIKKPTYVIDKILTEGSCGFIAGEPKCYKSWVGLDMALSVATGAPFLGEFRVVSPGPVLYIQEEDPPPTIKARAAKIWVNKATDKLELEPDSNEILWLPPERESEFDPDVNAYIQKGVTISDEAWMLWLDETLEKGMGDQPYKLMIIDTLMMTAGEVEETRAQEMTTKIFKPLKILARKHNVAIQVIHHMGKAEKARMGQRMLGSVANHAWSEDSIYLSRSGLSDIRMELESKTAPGGLHRISNLDNMHWSPEILPWRPDDPTPASPQEMPAQSTRRSRPKTARGDNAKLLSTIQQGGPAGMTTAQIAEALGVTRSTAHKKLAKLLDDGVINRKQLSNGSNIWKAEQ